MIAIQDILKLKTANMGGIARLELIFEQDILTFPAPDIRSQYLTGIMTLREGTRPYFLYFTSRSAQFSEKGATNNAAGDAYTQTVQLRTPKDRPALRTLIDRLRNNRVALVFQDRNGLFRLLRNMRLAPSRSTGTRGSYNGATFQFSGKTKSPSGFWQYLANPYISPYLPCPVDGDGNNDGWNGVGDTNFANTDLTFSESHTHNLGGHSVHLHSGNMTVGGDVEVTTASAGFIMTDGTNRWRLTIDQNGILYSNKI